MPLHLNVIAGPDQGITFPIPASGTVTIGRGNDANLDLIDGSVSRRHFQLVSANGQVRLVDLGSKTGTLVNNQPATTEVLLRAGDIIVAGATYFKFVAESGSSQASGTRPARGSSSAVGRAPAGPAAPRPAPETPQSLSRLVNTKLGCFAIGPLIGVGRSGAVFRAMDTRDRSEVALKVFLQEFSQDEEEVQRFTRAAKTIMPFRHRHLVDLLGAGRAEGHCWLSMELIEGPSVSWVVQQTLQGQADWRIGQRVMMEAGRALVYLHAKQVLHRNLTPENILMSREDGLIKVGDLITAKAQEGRLSEVVTAEGHMVGNVCYLPPERVAGDPSAGDERSDLYSLGAVVYATLVGVPPFQGNTSADTVYKIRNSLPVPVRVHQPNIPIRLELAVMRLLSKNPQDRFADAGELLRYIDMPGGRPHS
jgi:serine/threonine protein kinase